MEAASAGGASRHRKIFRSISSHAAEAQRLREQERARIPDYTAALAKATCAFQKHLMDLHPRYTNCRICGKHVKKIRTLIKRIGQILD
jgi:hypothetical protein